MRKVYLQAAIVISIVLIAMATNHADFALRVLATWLGVTI
jgi:hypothetical protein